MTVTRSTNVGKNKRKGGRRPADYVSQIWAAPQLGVTREHLNRVLNGHRQSRSLMARYKKLLRDVAKQHSQPQPESSKAA